MSFFLVAVKRLVLITGKAWKWDVVVQFNGKDFLQSHGTAMGTKTAVAFANVFMAKIEREILRQSNTTPKFWKRFIDEIITMWDTNRDKKEEFFLKANSFHPTIKFTAQISQTETIFLDTVVYKGDRLLKEFILDVRTYRTYFKPTETFQSNTRIFIRVTHQASRNVSLKEKR